MIFLRQERCQDAQLSDKQNTLYAQLGGCFSKQVWPVDQLLLVGAIYAPAKLSVTAVLRNMRLNQETHFHNLSYLESGNLVETGVEFDLGEAAYQHFLALRDSGDRKRRDQQETIL